jgi:hypothetical protein
MTQDIFNGILVAVLGASVSINGWFLRQVWSEVMMLRKSRHDHANLLTEHAIRLKHLEERNA